MLLISDFLMVMGARSYNRVAHLRLRFQLRRAQQRQQTDPSKIHFVGLLLLTAFFLSSAILHTELCDLTDSIRILFFIRLLGMVLQNIFLTIVISCYTSGCELNILRLVGWGIHSFFVVPA